MVAMTSAIGVIDVAVVPIAKMNITASTLIINLLVTTLDSINIYKLIATFMKNRFIVLKNHKLISYFT